MLPRKLEYFWIEPSDLARLEILTEHIARVVLHKWPGWKRELLIDSQVLQKIMLRCIRDEPEPIAPREPRTE